MRPSGVALGSGLAMNGLEPFSKTMSAAKKAQTAASTSTAPAVTGSVRSTSRKAITTVITARKRSQSRNEPCCPAQNPAMR